MWRNKDPVPDGSFQAAKSNSQNQEQFSLFDATWRKPPRLFVEVRNQILRLGVKVSLTRFDWNRFELAQQAPISPIGFQPALKVQLIALARFQAIFHTYLCQCSGLSVMDPVINPTFGKSARFQVSKNGTSGAETNKRRPLFNANIPPKWFGTRLFRAFSTFGCVLSQFW